MHWCRDLAAGIGSSRPYMPFWQGIEPCFAKRCIGEKRKKVLMDGFGSVEEILKHSEKEIAHKCKFSVSLAGKILENLRQNSNTPVEDKK